jgi:hypothetical protein
MIEPPNRWVRVTLVQASEKSDGKKRETLKRIFTRREEVSKDGDGRRTGKNSHRTAGRRALATKCPPAARIRGGTIYQRSPLPPP